MGGVSIDVKGFTLDGLKMDNLTAKCVDITDVVRLDDYFEGLKNKIEGSASWVVGVRSAMILYLAINFVPRKDGINFGFEKDK